jgi:hypothetical protein
MARAAQKFRYASISTRSSRPGTARGNYLIICVLEGSSRSITVFPWIDSRTRFARPSWIWTIRRYVTKLP